MNPIWKAHKFSKCYSYEKYFEGALLIRKMVRRLVVHRREKKLISMLIRDRQGLYMFKVVCSQ